MFFKKIEIIGFKSFANRTDVLFRPGITVIVGPNGCGKSNIFDAVRWVLGEQSAKQLRGQRMGDIIFSGSVTHAATAFAQVTLTISNEDRRLPIDFSEVLVTRRLMRTGESEYMINRHQCRLRDIVELFMDTGVGTNAYSIMEQGRIDQIINARPVDRREIFEEAAGVSKYRVRRAEAQRRLSRTEDDLIRLADIIAEVRRQSNSLKRQAARAERHRRLAGELRDLDMMLLAHRWRSHNADADKVRSELGETQDRLSEVSARLATLETEHERHQASSEEINRELHSLSAAIGDKTSTIHDTEHRAGLLRQRREINARRADELTAETENSGKRLRVLQHELERVAADRKEREESFAERERIHAERRAEADSARAGLDQSQREQVDLRRSLSDQRTAQITLDNEIRLSAIMGEKLQDEKQVLLAQREELEKEVSAAQTAAAEREAAHTAEATALDEANRRLEEIEARVSDLADEESEVDEAAQDCHTNLSESRSHLKALRALQENREGYIEGVRLILEAAENGQLSGVLGTVASLITPMPEHEAAIEAALNGGEQILITRTVADRDRALAWLREHGEGRATVLALESAALPTPLNRASDAQGAIAWGDEAVECGDEIRPAATHLLGNTLIVRDLDSALRLSADGTARRCATPQGEIAIAGVRVTGGRLKSSGLLTRDRQISELAEKVGRLEQEFEQLRSRRSDLAETLATVEEERRDLSQRRQRQEIRCTELQKDLEMAKREANTVAESMRRLDWRIGEIDKQAEQHLDARATAGERLDEVRAEISSLEEQLRDAEGHSETSGAETQRLNEEVQALAIEVARAREQLESLRLRHERAAAEVDEMQQRIKAAEAERERLLGENEEAEEQVQTLDARLTALMEERRELESRTTERRGVSDSAGVELRRLNQEIHVATRERNELQNRVHDLDLRKSQHEMHLEHCDAEAQEKFQTPMAEILKAHTEIPEDLTPLRDQAAQLRERLAGIGPVNVIAIEEYEELKTRLEFLSTQETDLLSAKRNLEHTIEELDRTSNRIFTESFEQIRNNFQQSFRRLFGGGRADLVALEPENLLESGIDIIAQPPGKKLQTISLLSGGEKALTAIALLFAIFLQKPSPFCVLDEIDAPLDDKNIGRFKDMLTEFAQTTQFIIITHNKLTMQLADTLFGITMEEPGVSRLVGVDIQAAAAYAA